MFLITYQSCHFLLIVSTYLLSSYHDWAARSLDEWVYVLLEIDSSPIVELQVEVQHFICKLSIFKLTTINDHGLSKDGSLMVLPGQDVDSFGSNDIVSFLYSIKIGYLVGTFTNLTFSVKHEAATKGVYLFVKWTWSMSASPLDCFVLAEVNILPVWFTMFNVIKLKTLQL